MIPLLAILLAVQSGETDYPHPVRAFELTIEGQAASMAFMDVPAVKPNGDTVLLLHGKNFNGFYWKGPIRALTDAGYRVVVPDQVGWGKSSKPKIHYSFHGLASNTKKLLDSLGVAKVAVVGHSMGGMLAVRFALMHPDSVSKLVLENPIGLEDYRAFVPYRSTDDLEKEELAATYESIKEYQKTYYPAWKPEYEPHVAAQAEALGKPDYPKVAFVNALTTQMIYEQPVVHEFRNLAVPTLLVIGQEDRTVVGKKRLPKESRDQYGKYPELGRAAQREIKKSRLVELPGVGHIPHVQAPGDFARALLEFLSSK